MIPGAGLSGARARALLEEVGPNELAAQAGFRGFSEFLRLVFNPLVVILFF
ncbi:MAG: cation-transporting P-type ATPase, partial [Bdellovibrionota bacterium]